MSLVEKVLNVLASLNPFYKRRAQPTNIFDAIQATEFAQAQVAILGLDNVGKKTLLQLLSTNPIQTETPTIGMHFDHGRNGATQFLAVTLGMSRPSSFYRMERASFYNAKAILWIIDLGAPERLVESEEEMRRAFQEPSETNAYVPMAILCNTIPAPEGYPQEDPLQYYRVWGNEGKGGVDAVRQRFSDADALRERPWECFEVDVKTGEGVNEAFEWLRDVLKDQKQHVELPTIKHG